MTLRPPDHILHDLPDRDADDYEAARALGPGRTLGAAMREGRYIVGSAIPLSEAR